MRTLRILIVMVLVLAVGSEAFAQRRGGLGGKYSARYMTAAKGSVYLMAGPQTSQGLADSLGGGLNFTNYEILDESLTSVDFNVGVAYGITPNIEAGLSLPLHLTTLGLPEGAEDNSDALTTLPVFLTYGKVIGGNMDVGVRVTTYIPIADGAGFTINPGVPLNVRLGTGRLEAGVFVPITIPDAPEGVEVDNQFGLTVPVRYGFNVNVNLFAGLQTGFLKGDLANGENDIFIPLGLFGGYTLLAGGSVIDLTAEFSWDRFLNVNAPEGGDSVSAGNWRVGIGANVQIDLMGG